jgi:hypothetical protein
VNETGQGNRNVDQPNIIYLKGGRSYGLAD